MDGLRQLKNDIKLKAPARFYVFFGEEAYLRRNYVDRLHSLLLDELTQSFNYHRFTEENFSLEAFSEALEALPMMAERSLVQVEDVNLFALPEGQREQLAQMLSQLPEYCCLLLCYEEFKPDKRMKKLWSAVEQNAVLVEFPYQSERDLSAWIRRHFSGHGKQIAPELCTYLLRVCGRSMAVLNEEIEKISAFCTRAEVTRADIDAVAEPTLEEDVFRIADALARREFDAALRCLNGLLRMQTEPIAIVAALGSQMRRLHAAKRLQSAGRGAGELAQLYGMASGHAGRTMQQAQRLSERFCARAVLLCAEADLQLKTGGGAEIPELLLLTLSQEVGNA